MTQFTFSELKPRIEEAITERSGTHRHSDMMPPHRMGLTTVKCPRCVSGLCWNNEPIELVDGFDTQYKAISLLREKRGDVHKFYFSNESSDITVRAIGKHTGQVYTWSLKALLPELWEEEK